MNSNGNMDGSGHKGKDELPSDWTWERFHVVDAGNGEIALWSEIHGKYIRMHENGNMDASGSKGKDELPSDWTWERFKVVDGGNGQWALWNPIHNRYMRINSDGNMDGSGHKGPDELPSDWTWERFAVVVVQPAGAAAPAPAAAASPFGPLEPGSIVALHSEIHNRFVRMNSNGNMDGSGHKGKDELPSDWTWERFHVVDAGNGEIALWSEIHGKYIRMHENGNMDASGSKGKDELPSDWTWERFKVVDGGNGQWALWNPIHNRYMRINSDGNMDGSGHKGPDELPSDWTWERFAVVVVQPAGGAAAPAAPAEEPKIMIKEADTGDWGRVECDAGTFVMGGGCQANGSPHVFEKSAPDGNGWGCGGGGGPKRIWAICGPQDVVQVVEVETGDWGEAECPAGTEVLGGGCQAYRGPHIAQASMIRGKGARRTSYKCGGQGGDKRIYAMCAPPMGVNVKREHGGDWHQVMCPAGQTVVGGGCDAKKSPYKFEYNGPVIDGDRTGWKCGGHSGDKKVKVACKPDSARAERAPPR